MLKCCRPSQKIREALGIDDDDGEDMFSQSQSILKPRKKKKCAEKTKGFLFDVSLNLKSCCTHSVIVNEGAYDFQPCRK